MLCSVTYHIYKNIVQILLHETIKLLAYFFSFVTDLRLGGNNIFYQIFILVILSFKRIFVVCRVIAYMGAPASLSPRCLSPSTTKVFTLINQ
jgi:hypothetical protein